MRRVFKRLVPLLLVAFVLTGCGGSSEAEKLSTKPVTLKVWHVFDGSDSLRDAIKSYKTLHPNVTIEHRTLRFDEYEEELLRAFAEGDGPDIFSVHNTWLKGYQSLMQPMPASVSIPYQEIRGTVKKDVVYTLKEEPTISLRRLKSEYVDVVADDVIMEHKPDAQSAPEDKIWGLPLSVDSLAMYYNKDLLNAAGIPEPAASWTDFQEQVTKLTRVGQDDTVLQSGAAIGTSRNVERAFDILSLLMMQNGTQMTDSRGFARFGTEIDRKNLGGDALMFYTDFSNPLKEVYSWNDDQPSSFEAFVNGKTAFFFGYSYHADLIRRANEKLDFSIVPVPQIDGGRSVNYANYWVETVSKSTENSDWAWDFIEFVSEPEQVTTYLEITKKPTALRSLVGEQVENEDLSVFATQVLTAESWYRGKDALAAEKAFLDMIDEYRLSGDVKIPLRNAMTAINQTVR